MRHEETWRPAVGYEGLYSVSSHGRVRSEDRVVVDKSGIEKRCKGRVLKARSNRGGYLCLAFSVEGRRIAVRVHCAVALAFIGPCPSTRHEVAHEDGNRQNNNESNLRWDTRAGNFADKVKHGTHNRGEQHPNCRLKNAEVAAIRDAGMSPSQAAHMYGISREYAKRVLSNTKRRAG